MTAVRDVLAALELIAPSSLTLAGDHVGLQVGDPDAGLERAIVSFDRSTGAVRAALDSGAQLLVSHHPLIWDPLTRVSPIDPIGRTVIELLRGGVAHIAAHTNWDCAEGGISDAIADLLGLQDRSGFSEAGAPTSLKLVAFAPASAAEAIVDAAAAAGAGAIGGYRRCVFAAPGEGSFEAPAGARPAAGRAGARNAVPEVRIEMELPEGRRRAVEAAVRAAHPYEVPAIDFYALKAAGAVPVGRVGALPSPMSPEEFGRHVDARFQTRSWVWSGGRPIRRVAVVGGAGDFGWAEAVELGCEGYVTGEVRQHFALDASASGLTMVAAGHYASEQPGTAALCERLKAAVPEVEWTLFVPPPGSHGRPF